MNTLYYDYTVEVLNKHIKMNGNVRYDRLGRFRFCAQSRDEAFTIAFSNVKPNGPDRDELQIRIIDSLPV